MGMGTCTAAGPAAAWVAMAAVVSLVGCGGGGNEDERGDAGGTGSGSDGSGGAVVAPAPAPDRSSPEVVDAMNRAAGLMRRYDYDAALAEIDALLARDPAWVRLRVDRAIAVMNRQDDGDEQLARTELNAVLEDAPDDIRALYVGGLLDLRAGDVDRAGERLGRVAELDPDDPYVAYFHGQAIEGSDPAAALAAYERAESRDPYLRSAPYRAASVLRRLGRAAEAGPKLQQFMALADDPRARTAEFVYTRMGDKAEVGGLAESPEPGAVLAAPAGPVFESAEALVPDADVRWSGVAAPIALDLDGDGRIDVLAMNAIVGNDGSHAVMRASEDGRWSLDRDHPLARMQGRFALAADLDDDGDTDLHVGGMAGSRTWFRDPDADGGWRADVLHESPALADGLCYDVDHDGDLDVLLATLDGDLRLLRQSDEGQLAFDAESPLVAPVEGMRAWDGLAVGDVDGDRDLDIFVSRAPGGPVLFRNERLGAWTTELIETPVPLRAAVAADADADGRPEIYAQAGDGTIGRWRDGDGWSEPDSVAGAPAGGALRRARFAIVDVDGVPGPEMVSVDESGAPVAVPVPGEVTVPSEFGTMPWTLVLEDERRGPSMMTFGEDGPKLHRPGPGRHDFVAFDLRGRVDAADSLRSNAAGIGTEWAVRTGVSWSVGRRLRSAGGPGQSLQPIAVGLGGASRADYLVLEWSDGVAQSEVHGAADAGADPIDLSAGNVVTIVETQRQLSSCPIIFTWDGERWVFVSDVLGVGGLGYLVEPGVFAEPRPRERFLFPDGVLAPRDGRFEIRLHEPMEEICLLDHAALDVWDLPPDWDVVPDERLALDDRPATGEPRFYRRSEIRRLVAATDASGRDVLGSLTAIDDVAAPGPAPHRRFIGTRTGEQVLELVFDGRLDEGSAGSTPTLVVDGWVEYPYSQTNYAAAGAGVVAEPPTLEARGADGVWRVVAPSFGYPAGMPRRMSLPLVGLPDGCDRLRIRTTLEVYWDHLFVVPTTSPEQMPSKPILTRLEPMSATLARTGFPRRTTGPQRRPWYDDSDRAAFSDMRSPRGLLTRMGDVLELVSRIDDASAVFGPGEEVRLGFDAPESAPSGWTRRVVLDVSGWCKDMDLFTRDGDTVEPLPSRDGEGPGAEARALDAAFRTRLRDGR